jgi:hypothetical protein
MKFLSYLKEEYLDLYKNWSGGVEVYVNPTPDDIKALRNVDGIRFSAQNSTKRLFIWDAGKCNHQEMITYLVQRKHIKPLEPRIALNPDFFNGDADISGKKLSINDSDDFIFFSIETLEGRLKKNWDWLKPYFVNLNFIHNLQKDLQLTKGKIADK